MARLGLDNDTFVVDNDGTITSAQHEGISFGRELIAVSAQLWGIQDERAFRNVVEQTYELVDADPLAYTMTLGNPALPDTYGDRIPGADGLIYHQIVMKQALDTWFEGQRDLDADGGMFYSAYKAAYAQTPVFVRADAIAGLYSLRDTFGMKPVIVTNTAEIALRERWKRWDKDTTIFDEFPVIGGAQKYVMGNLPKGALNDRLMQSSPVIMAGKWPVQLNRPMLYQALIKAGSGKLPQWYVGDIAQWDLVSQEQIVRAAGGTPHSYLLTGALTLDHERAYMNADPEHRVMVPTFDMLLQHLATIRKAK